MTGNLKLDKVFIYSLIDPTTELVRYVGKTCDPTSRLRKHLTEKNKTFKCQWIKGLKAKGLQPKMEILDECEASNWEEKERFYIRLFKAVGATLVNTLPGGEGGATMTGKRLTEEQRAKITASKLGKSNTGAAQSNKIHKGYTVNQYDLSGNLVAVHGSIRDAAIAVNRNPRRIQTMISGKKVNGKSVNHIAGYRFVRATV
jgi:hypothetical protein